MDNNLKESIFNPKDKLSEQKNEPKIYLDYVPKEKKSIVKENNCNYDNEKYKWYTTDKNNKIIHENFSHFSDIVQYINFYFLFVLAKSRILHNCGIK